MNLFSSLQRWLLRHAQTAITSIGKHWERPFSYVLTSLTIGIALALPAGLFIIMLNLAQVGGNWQDNGQISVFLHHNVPENRAAFFAEELQAWTEITHTQHQTASESLAEFKQRFGMEDVLKNLSKNPLPAVIFATPTRTDEGTLKALLQQIQAEPDVDSAQIDTAWLQRLRSLHDIGKRGVTLLGALLFLSVFLIIGNSIRLDILGRRIEISILKLFGSTTAFVRRPFLYGGLWYGTLGGLFAWLILLITFSLLYQPLDTLAMQYGSSLNLQWHGVSSLFILPTIGAVLGVISAWLTVHQCIREIELH